MRQVNVTDSAVALTNLENRLPNKDKQYNDAPEVTSKQLHRSPATVSSIGQCLALYVSSQEPVPKRKLDVLRKICDGFLVGLYHTDVCS